MMWAIAVTSATSNTAWPYRKLWPKSARRTCVYQYAAAVTTSASVTDSEATSSAVGSAAHQLRAAARKTAEATVIRPR